MYNFGIVAIARLAFQVFGVGSTPILGLLLTVGIISALLGAVMALAQDDLKRLLAYDTISQMGILAIGLGTGTAAGTAGTVYHLVNHALFKSLLFLCAGAILHRTGLTRYPARYASGVLTGTARLPALHLPFDYVSPGELASVAGCAVAGAALAWAYLRAREPGPVRLLRAVHTGSVNDYAAYAVAGLLAVIAVLTLT